MRKYIFPIILVLIVSLVFLVSGCNSNSKDTIQSNVSPSQDTSTSWSKVLRVNDIQADPSSFTDTITINGVMAGVSQTDQKLFGLVDTAEVKACKSVGCSTFILPVKYDGKLPQVGDEVNVTGSFVGSDNDLVFIATSFKVLGNIIPQGGK